MSIAIWSDDYATGYFPVDSQHQQLFKLINNLHNAMLSGSGKVLLNNTLSELVNYTQKHFQMGENLMKTYQYPNYPDHKKRHEEYAKKVDEFAKKLNAGQNPTTLVIEVSSFLTEWWINHIKKIDQPMINFLKQYSQSA
jgi:hemerythrin